MSKFLSCTILFFIALNANAVFHPGFVNLKQCVYYKDGASHRSDCTNKNTTCLSDGRCTVKFANSSYDGDVDNLIVLRSADQYQELEPYQFSNDDILDLRKSKLRSNQIILDERE